MREILFRGKRTDNGEWICSGNLIHFNEDNEYYIPVANSKCTCTHDENDNIVEWNEVVFCKVIPETVGQYTGINVGNEKLFEGDIVECHEDYDDSWGFSKTSVVRAVVVWDEENFCWAFEIEKKYRQPFNDWTWDNSFINGNIHDNPELLKGGVEE